MPLLERVRKALEPTFVVERQLGAGGMGIVFEAWDPRLERKVAVKVLRPESATAVASHRFLREAQLLARLKHPNIVQVHQAGEGDGLSWFVMDLVQGETLAARLSRGPLSTKETMSLARELLSALALAHEHNVVHRDIKPANIFLEKGRALLADFGIARSTTTSGSDAGLTGTRDMIGTPAYMAPEQMGGDPAGPAVDQYALGLVLYECLTGKRWPALQAPSSGDWRGVPASVAAALRRAIATDPAERWPDVQAFATALGSRRNFVPWAVAAAAVAALAWVGNLVLKDKQPSDPWSPGSAAIPSSRSGRSGWEKAEQLYLRGAWVEADTAYRSVLARDTACLACEFRLVEVDRWLERRADSSRIVRLRNAGTRFSEPWSRLLDATLAPAGERIELLEDLAKNDYRKWPLAWYYLGTELFNRGALFGRTRTDAVDALSQHEALAPEFVPAWTDRTLLRIAIGDSIGADSSLRQLQSLPHPEGLPQAQRLLAGIAFAFRFTPGGLEMWRQASRDTALLRGLPELGAGPRVLPGVGTPLGGVELGRAFEESDQPPLQRSGLIAQMLGSVALGRLDSARRAGQRLNADFPSQLLGAFAVMLDAAVVLLDDECTASEAARVESALAPFTRSIMPPLARRDAAWLMALAALRQRNEAGVRATLALIADEAAPGFRQRFITALLLNAAGQPDSAIALTNTARSDLEAWHRAERSPLLRAAIRLSRARWFEIMGAPENARAEYRWHQHFHLPDYPLDYPLPAEGDWAFSTLASWRQARLLDRGAAPHTRDAEVCASYKLVAERWSLGASRFRARADTARSRFAALGCDGAS